MKTYIEERAVEVAKFMIHKHYVFEVFVSYFKSLNLNGEGISLRCRLNQHLKSKSGFRLVETEA